MHGRNARKIRGHRLFHLRIRSFRGRRSSATMTPFPERAAWSISNIACVQSAALLILCRYIFMQSIRFPEYAIAYRLRNLLTTRKVVESEKGYNAGNVIPPCSGGTVQTREVFLPQCWSLSPNPYSSGGPGGGGFIPGYGACSPPQGWCEVICNLCMDHGILNRTCTGNRFSSEPCGGGVMPPSWTGFVGNVCYDQGCTGDY